MVELVQKKVGKLIGLKKSDFNNLIKAKEIFLSKPRLIPLYKLGDEMALTSVLLSSLCLIKEFKQTILAEAKMQKGGSLYVYTEITFKDFPESRIDGLILVVKAGTIRDASFLEVKNGKNTLEKEQLERYQQIARQYAIPKFITISNQFVSDSTQSPVSLRKVRGLDMHHFSWTYLLTIAHVLLFKNDQNIEDEDQVQIMKEVLHYLEADKSGVVGLNQMNLGWSDVVEKINSGAKIKISDPNVGETVLSWQQEERDMALALSRELGVLVNTGEQKFKGKLDDRLKDNAKSLISSKKLESTFRITGSVSDIRVSALFEKRTVEMSISIKPPVDKTYKGQLGWLKRQFNNCMKKDEELFKALAKELYFEVLIKNSRLIERFSIFDFEQAEYHLKSKDFREFKIVLLKDFGKKFSSPKKFVEILEEMLKKYYKCVVQNFIQPKPITPKISSVKKDSADEEFIDDVNMEKSTDESSRGESFANKLVPTNIDTQK